MEKMQKDLLPGWTAKRTKHYLVLSHADAKYTARIVEAVSDVAAAVDARIDVGASAAVAAVATAVAADLTAAGLTVPGGN